MLHSMLDTMVEGFADTDSGIDVKLKNAPTLHTDMVIMAIGVAPETTLAKEAGLELGMRISPVQFCEPLCKRSPLLNLRTKDELVSVSCCDFVSLSNTGKYVK